MSLRPSFKLTLPVVAIALLIALAAWPGVRPQTAEATISSLSASSLVGDTAIAITVSGTTNNGTLTVTNNAGENFTVSSCNDGSGACPAPGGGGTPTVTLNTDTADDPSYTLVLSMALTCGSSVEEITVTATESGGTADSESIQVFCVPDDNDPQVVVRKEADNTSFNYDFTWSASGGNCVVDADGDVDLDNDGGFDLEDGERAEFWCEDSVSLSVNEQDDNDFTEIDACDEGDEGVDDISGDRVIFDISDLESGDTVTCIWINEGELATATPVAGPVTSVVVSAANITSCGGTTAVQVTLRNASGGPAPAGTSITATSSAGGTFQPSATLTGNFPFSFATFLYQAPPTFNGIATITVRTSNNVTGVVNIQVICGAPAPTATVAPLKPPSAGDGGLLGGGGAGGAGFGPYLPSTLAVTIAAVVMGATLISRRREADAVPVTAAPEVTRDARTQASSRPGGYAILASLALTGLALLLKRSRR